MLHVERCFGASGKPLQREGRFLLGEGVLTKVCRKSAKPRQFFLFNDLLVYGTIVKDRKKVRTTVARPARRPAGLTVPLPRSGSTRTRCSSPSVRLAS